MNERVLYGHYSGNFKITLKVFLLLSLLLNFQSAVHASMDKRTENVLQQQDLKVKGNVVDPTGYPLPGVTVIIKGTKIGTVTDANGDFVINSKSGSILTFSFIGFKSKEVVVSSEKLKIVLDEDLKEIDEVVIVGYGVQKKETVTGSLSTISASDLAEQPVSNVSQALAGRLPGLIANMSGGRPGKDGATIKIRGIGTLDAGSGSNPLILIDGIERDQSALNFLDPNEIESLSILKDASSTAVFGVRGANGVILVNTKRGKLGPAQINYKASTAVMLPTFK
ncbi:MAG: TonB-dependent receptor plug domain-containing protein, partial [Ignavibacteria bacterium]|nr:TonB-dependent receptor plug domain-containing protein [Ignavibacteria bacterium]